MTSDEVLKLVADFAPMVLTVMGSTLTVLISTVAALARLAWNSHKRRMDLVVKSIDDLARSVKHSEDQSEAENRKLWDATQGLRAEIALASRSSEHTKSGLLRVEGALEQHRSTLYQHIEKIGKLDSKLDAVFRFIDAPRRGSEA